MDSKDFYDDLYTGMDYASSFYADAAKPSLENFIAEYNLRESKVLDIGCGRGFFKDLVDNWLGIDISESVGRVIDGKFICASAEAIPLRSESMNVIWSITFLEHSPDPEISLSEMSRVLMRDGMLYISPAWRVPPWRAKGYEIKRYSELNFKGKLTKIFLPIINLIWTKGILWIPRRVIRELSWLVCRKPTKLRYTKFMPNFDEFLLPDSDACNSLDSHEVLIWFLSRGYVLPYKHNFISRILMRCAPVIVIKDPIDETEY